jgi:hypothetical protein
VLDALDDSPPDADDAAVYSRARLEFIATERRRGYSWTAEEMKFTRTGPFCLIHEASNRANKECRNNECLVSFGAANAATPGGEFASQRQCRHGYSTGGGAGNDHGDASRSRKGLRYYFQHPYPRLFVAYLVIFCNFLLFAEDPISHSYSGEVL